MLFNVVYGSGYEESGTIRDQRPLWSADSVIQLKPALDACAGRLRLVKNDRRLGSSDIQQSYLSLFMSRFCLKRIRMRFCVRTGDVWQ